MLTVHPSLRRANILEDLGSFRKGVRNLRKAVYPSCWGRVKEAFACLCSKPKKKEILDERILQIKASGNSVASALKVKELSLNVFTVAKASRLKEELKLLEALSYDLKAALLKSCAQMHILKHTKNPEKARKILKSLGAEKIILVLNDPKLKFSHKSWVGILKKFFKKLSKDDEVRRTMLEVTASDIATLKVFIEQEGWNLLSEKGFELLLHEAHLERYTEDIQNKLLEYAINKGYQHSVKMLVKANVNLQFLNEKGNTPLHIACTLGNKEIALCLFKNTFGDINQVNQYSKMTFLHCAAFSGNRDIVQRILKAKPKLDLRNALGETALHLAVKQQNFDIVDDLLWVGADPMIQDNKGNTPLHLATHFGNLEITKLFLKKPRIRDTHNKQGNTPLHVAVLRGHSEVVQKLLEDGCSVNARDIKGDTPLACAVRKNDLKLAELLVDGGSVLDVINRFGETPLALAAKKGFFDMVKFLLEEGAFPKINDLHGNTALHAAARGKHHKVMNLLILYGADPDRNNMYHRTPRMLLEKQ